LDYRQANFTIVAPNDSELKRKKPIFFFTQDKVAQSHLHIHRKNKIVVLGNNLVTVVA